MLRKPPAPRLPKISANDHKLHGFGALDGKEEGCRDMEGGCEALSQESALLPSHVLSNEEVLFGNVLINTEFPYAARTRKLQARAFEKPFTLKEEVPSPSCRPPSSLTAQP